MKYRPKSGVGAAPKICHTTPFIDKYVGFLEYHGRKFNDMPDFKNTEFFRIQHIKHDPKNPTEAELLETTDTYIRLHSLSTLTQTFMYPSPSAFYKHYFDIINSKEFNKDAEDADVKRSLSNPQIKEQIDFMLEHLTLSWGNKFPRETRVRLLARSFTNFDKFCQTEEFQKLPESIQSQFSRFQTVRNFYRYVEKNPQIIDIRKSPVMTVPYLRSIIKHNQVQD